MGLLSNKKNQKEELKELLVKLKNQLKLEEKRYFELERKNKQLSNELEALKEIYGAKDQAPLVKLLLKRGLSLKDAIKTHQTLLEVAEPTKQEEPLEKIEAKQTFSRSVLNDD